MYHIHQLRRVKVGSLSHYLQGLMHPRWLFGILPARNSPFHPRRARSSRPRQWRAQHDLRHPSLLARLPSWRVNIWAGLVFYMPKFPSQTQVIWSHPPTKTTGAHLSHSFHGNFMGMRTVLVWQPDSLTMSHLETLLKFSTILGATDQRTHIQGNDTAILDAYPTLPITRMLTAKWGWKNFLGWQRKRSFEHILEIIFGQTNPTFRASGTSLVTTRWARPSTMAVLPTPGSPTSVGWLGWSEIIRAALGVQGFLLLRVDLETRINQSNRYMDKKPRYQLLDTRFILLIYIHFCNVLYYVWLLDTIFPFLQPSTANHLCIQTGPSHQDGIILRSSGQNLGFRWECWRGFGGWDPTVFNDW